MILSKKSIYALRAVFELSFRDSSEPVKIYKIAHAQNIPPRFLEVILNQLKHLGYVQSMRGKEGGYFLSRKPHELTVGEVIRAVQGPIGETDIGTMEKTSFPRSGDFAFNQMSESIKRAVCDIYDNMTFSDLIELEQTTGKPNMVNYSI